jgi:hypothetical protein
MTKRETFTLNGKKMVYDRGRYKEATNVGSQSAKKAKKSFFERIFGGVLRKEVVPKEAVKAAETLPGALKQRADTIKEIEAEIQKQYK